MKLRILGSAILCASTVASASAKAPNAEFLQARKEAAQIAAAAPVATVGDADSFGRYVKFAGLMTSGVITLASDCTPDPSFPPGPDDHCYLTDAAGAATNFVANDVARILVPAKTANSMLCHWQTPVVVYAFSNPTGSYRPNARILVTPSYTIQNAALNDPSLINPNTGLPFGGSLTLNLVGIRHSRGLQPGDFQVERENSTRACIDGLISKNSLVNSYGLNAVQAANFFKNDTVITMNITGITLAVDFATIIYGTRFVVD